MSEIETFIGTIRSAGFTEDIVAIGGKIGLYTNDPTLAVNSAKALMEDSMVQIMQNGMVIVGNEIGINLIEFMAADQFDLIFKQFTIFPCAYVEFVMDVTDLTGYFPCHKVVMGLWDGKANKWFDGPKIGKKSIIWSDKNVN